MANMVLITGNTYPVKDQIKALGGRWNADAKGWNVPADKAEEARKLVAGAGSKSNSGRSNYSRSRSYSSQYCGYPCPVTGLKCCAKNGPCHDCQ